MKEKLFRIARNDGRRLILLTAPIGRYEEMRAQAVFANRLIREGLVLTMPPVEVAACKNDTLCYALYGCIEAKNAADFLNTLTTPEQYEFGLKAGKMLRKIHSIKPDENNKSRRTDFRIRAHEAIASLENTKTSFDGFAEIKAFLKNKSGLLENRPEVMLYGEFSSRNIFVYGELVGVFTPKNALCGDPLSDFGALCASGSVPFMKGQISGYFSSIPKGFFELLGFYTALFSLERIVFAESPQKKLYAMRLAERACADFSGFTQALPKWYR